MSEILLCRLPLDADQLRNHCALDIDQLISDRCEKPSVVSAYTPYLVGGGASSVNVLRTLSTPPVARGLTELALTLGSDSLLPMASIRDQLQQAGVGLASEAAGLAHRRGSAFVKAVREYQAALLEYRQAVVAKTSNRASARRTAQRAFDEMQRRFGTELNRLSAQIKARRGTPLSSAERAFNIANSSRSVAKLHVANVIEASALAQLALHAKVLVNGLAIIDFGAGVGNIRNEYRAGGNWYRELFIESSSFVLSASMGAATGLAANAALTLIIMLTPVGWVGLVGVIGGLAVVGVTAGASLALNNFSQTNAGSWYDAIMEGLGFL